MISTIDAYSKAYRERIAARQSPLYLQAGPRGQRRMEQAMDMGLGMMADPSSYRRTGQIDPFTKRPIYGISRSPFGSWGGVGMDREQSSTGKLKAGAPLGSAGSSGYDLAERMRRERDGGPQPMEETPEIAQSPMGDTGSPFGFTPFAERMRQEEESRQSGLFGGMASLTGFGSIPRFPYSNY